MYLCCLILKWQIILLFVHWVCNLHIISFILLMKKIVYRNMYKILFIHTIYISYLFVFRWSDIRRLKSVARCIVPIELVHVWWKLLYCSSKAKNQSSLDCHHKGVDKKVIILKSTSQSMTCPRRCCTGWETGKISQIFRSHLLSSKSATEI